MRTIAYIVKMLYPDAKGYQKWHPLMQKDNKNPVLFNSPSEAKNQAYCLGFYCPLETEAVTL